MKFSNLLLCISVCLLFACKATQKSPEAIYEELQGKLIAAKAGDVIDIPAGTYEFTRPLSLDGIDNITIKGAGMDKTVLSFKGQTSGAEGLKITANNVTISDLSVLDTKGDCIKLQDCEGVTITNVKTSWTGGALPTNGGYGLYPVACKNVLIDNCVASFASDAGIYVGQSENVIVRNSYAHENVAGIEIENCVNAEVYNCKAENNTGGILVFDLPDLPKVNGHSCRVYDNEIINNNHENFAPEGNIVGTVPPGTGVILMAAKKVEVFNNKIIGHKTMGVSVSSYQITQRKWKSEEYDPFSYDIHFHDNAFERPENMMPDSTKDGGKLVYMLAKGATQDIVFDGIANPAKEDGPNICISESQEGLRFINVDAMNEYKGLSTDLSTLNCEGITLQEVVL